MAVFSQQLLNQININVGSFIKEYINKTTLVITNNNVSKLMGDMNTDSYSVDNISKGKEVEGILQSISSFEILDYKKYYEIGDLSHSFNLQITFHCNWKMLQL